MRGAGGANDPARIKLLIGFTGSVASVKFKELITQIQVKDRFEIKVVLTQCAQRFISKEDISSVGLGTGDVYTDSDEWTEWEKIGDPVVHIDLAKWANVLLVAPLTANTLAKFANGLCDNLLTCVFRAWSFSEKMVVLAPAMNTQMWLNPFTERHLDAILRLIPPYCGRGCVHICQPVEKRLACGDTGIGAMAEVDTIALTLDKLCSRDR